MSTMMRMYRALISNLSKSNNDMGVAVIRNTKTSKDTKKTSVKNKVKSFVEAHTKMNAA